MNDQKLYDKLVARTKPDGDCWIWQGAVGSVRQYQSAVRGETYYNGEYLSVHRAMWMAAYGPIPEKRCVCHSCDSSLCVNPEHLWLGTHQQNMQDMRLKGRSSGASATHCKQGHPLSGDNLVQTLLVGKNPQRRCKICRDEYNRRTYVPSPPKPQMPKEQRIVRDASIFAEYQAGASVVEIAAKHQLSKTLCFGIIKKLRSADTTSGTQP